MEVKWNDDEGYDVRYGRIMERYGIKLTHEDAVRQVPKLLQEMLDRESQFQRKKEEDTKKAAEYAAQIPSLEASLRELQKELEIQRGHYAVEPRVEYKNKIEAMERSIENAKNEMDRLRKSIDTSNQSEDGGLDPDLFSAYVKAASYLKHRVELAPAVPGLPLRNTGTPMPCGPDLYERVLDSIRARAPDTVYVNHEELFFAEQEIDDPEWSAISQEGYEILARLRAGKRKASAFNSRLYLPYDADFFCEISAVKIRDEIHTDGFDIGILKTREKSRHPIFTDFEIYLPRSFVLFNDTWMLRHDFRIRRTGIASCMIKNQDVDYDDE